MALVGVGKMDDGIKKSSDRKVINVEAELVEAVNDYALELEDRFGFRPTFAQALKFILKELRSKKL